MAKVALIRCGSYDYTEVGTAVQKGIDLLGGVSVFAKPGEKIVLKPNWLVADAPEKCVVTHPSVFKAVAEVFVKAGAKLSYGDSPAFHNPETAAKKCGFAPIADELGITLADFRTGKEVSFKAGIQNKKFTLAKSVLDNDGLISIAKLKPHGFQKITGSIKNQFGCIPGTLKGEFHVRVPNALDFAKMLVDLNLCIKPRLFIMDAIIAMEGNGPRGGTPKKMDLLLFSTDPVALDATVCRIINLDPAFVPVLKFGTDAGLGVSRATEIEYLGDLIQGFIDKKFDIGREPLKAFKPSGALRFAKNIIVPKPYIIESKCFKCGVCVKMCPVNPKAVDWHDGNKQKQPSYKYDRCIRCYCCQELCPESAIHLKMPFIRRILGSLFGGKKPLPSR